MKNVCRTLFLLGILFWGGKIVLAEDSPTLKLSGLANATLSLADIEALPSVTFETGLPFFEGKAQFTGVKLADLVAKFGAKAKEIDFSAIDDYTIIVPVSDWQKYDVILAYKRDGKYMPLDQMGPFWIIYPQDQHPELKTKDVEARMIWQVTKADLR